MKMIAVYILLLLGYTFIYVGVSKFWHDATMIEQIATGSPTGGQ